MNEKEFLWGAATSSYQVEGSITNNDWAHWEKAGSVEGGVLCGLAVDHRKHFRTDLKMAAEMGLNSYRFSVEWARVEPEPDKWDESAFEWYSDLISECEKLGLKPMLTLHHFTLPKWFSDLGGLASDEAPKYFSRYVKKVIEKLGERIPLWCTINEPIVLVIGSYLGGFMPPAVFSPKKASLAVGNLLRCHCQAYDLIHNTIKTRKGPWKDDELLVGYAHNVLGFRPERKTHFIEQVLSKKAEHFYNDAWILATLGEKQNFKFPFLISRVPEVPEARNRRTCDFIGLNYYTKAYIQWWPRAKAQNKVKQVPVGVSFARRNEQTSDLDWVIDSKAFRKLILRFSQYGLPIFITENGIADREDSKRPEYLVKHLRVIAEMIEKGIDIRGYYHWSLIDNFEWVKGFWPRFGLISVDYTTHQRTLTRSATLYREIISQHRAKAPQLATLSSFENIHTS